MVDLFFSEFFFQFVILATKNISADVAEKFLLAVVTRWALPIFLMNCPLEKSCIVFLSRLMFLMFLKTNVFLRLLFLRSLSSISNWYIVIVSLCGVRIRNYSGPHFPEIKYLSVFSTNVRKDGPE